MKLTITNIPVGTEENEAMADDMAEYLRGLGYVCYAAPDALYEVDKPISPFMAGVMARLMGGRRADELTPDEWNAAVRYAREKQEARVRAAYEKPENELEEK